MSGWMVSELVRVLCPRCNRPMTVTKGAAPRVCDSCEMDAMDAEGQT